MCSSEGCQEAVWCGVSGDDQAMSRVVAFNTRQGTVGISLPPCTESAPCSKSSSTACRITGSWQKAAGEGKHLHRCNLVKMSSISHMSEWGGQEDLPRQVLWYLIVPAPPGPKFFPSALFQPVAHPSGSWLGFSSHHTAVSYLWAQWHL